MAVATIHLPRLSENQARQIARANSTMATPVVFVHGLWLQPSSWRPWVKLFEEAGYVAVTPGLPDDPEGVGEVADYAESIIRRLERRPVVVGHSFGGLLAEILAGRGLSRASVAVSPTPSRGVVPLPFSSPLTYEQFRYAFANALADDEAVGLYERYSVPRPGRLNPWIESRIDSINPDRGPLLIISADSDHTVPWPVAYASFERERGNSGVTEIVKMNGRGHSLTIDHGWREVADTALAFLRRFS
jgi:non-heme chloroperoxidase